LDAHDDTAAQRRIRVLLAEADPAAAVERVRVLNTAAFAPTVLEDDRDIVSEVRRLHPDILLLGYGYSGRDPAKAVRVIRSDVSLDRTGIVVTCPTHADATRVRELVDAGVLGVLVEPIDPKRLINTLSRTAQRLREHPSAAQLRPDEDAVIESVGGELAKYGNKVAKVDRHHPALLVRPVRCPLHEDAPLFKRHTLRLGKVRSEIDFFDTEIYTRAKDDAPFCDFNRLAVLTCPRCLFSSTHYDLFDHPTDPRHERVALEPRHIHPLADLTPRRQRLAGSLSRSFFSASRTVDDAILAYQLAIHCSAALYDADRLHQPLELARMGNYHLRINALLRQQHELTLEDPVPPQWHSRYRAALNCFKRAFRFTEGPPLYRTIYQLIAVGVYVGDHHIARHAMARLRAFDESDQLSDDHRRYVSRYLGRARKAWEDREFHTARLTPAASAA